jgi:membrane-associated phospholipid phosphatase
VTLLDQFVDQPVRSRSRSSRAAIGAGLVTAVGSAVAVVICWRVFVATTAGQRVDQAVLEGASYGHSVLWPLAQRVLDVVSVSTVALVLLAAILIAVMRRRWQLAAQVAILMAGANLTTQVLKSVVFVRPHLGQAPDFGNTLPSGHVTAAGSASAALVFVVPPRARPWAALAGAAYTAATGVSTLVGRWHRPSDVIAAVFVVLAWSGLACALAATSTSDTPRGTPTGSLSRAPRRRDLTSVMIGSLLVSALAASLPAAMALRQTWQTAGRIDTRSELLTAYAGGGFGIVAISFAAFAVLLVVRRSAGRATPADEGRPAPRVHPA